jgi:hypothetical protein
MSAAMQRFTIRYRHASGTSQRQPSSVLRQALFLLSMAEELEPRFTVAEDSGKIPIIEVFRDRNGQPLLIHFGEEDA